jgi:hypothetical protein
LGESGKDTTSRPLPTTVATPTTPPRGPVVLLNVAVLCTDSVVSFTSVYMAVLHSRNGSYAARFSSVVAISYLHTVAVHSGGSSQPRNGTRGTTLVET